MRIYFRLLLIHKMIWVENKRVYCTNRIRRPFYRRLNAGDAILVRMLYKDRAKNGSTMRSLGRLFHCSRQEICRITNYRRFDLTDTIYPYLYLTLKRHEALEEPHYKKILMRWKRDLRQALGSHLCCGRLLPIPVYEDHRETRKKVG